MKTIALCFLALSSLAMANLGTPLDAVKTMIRGANEREIVRVNLEKVGMKAEDVVRIFNAVDVDKAHFVSMGGEGKPAWWKNNEKDENFQLRMANPMCIGFEVRFVKDEKLGCGGYYEVVKIQL